jgi:hypothetical protein
LLGRATWLDIRADAAGEVHREGPFCAHCAWSVEAGLVDAKAAFGLPGAVCEVTGKVETGSAE